MRSMSASSPYKWVTTTARMSGERASSIVGRERPSVSGSTSAKRTRNPRLRAVPVVYAPQFEAVKIASPLRQPTALSASSRASVPLATPMQCPTPTKAANSVSNAACSEPRM